ncbi:heparan-alpha-glucosaminide N-acetyltransferase domain-containing protein [Prauserella alba]|uniref:Heparan-alpha-glucosaminide N-acetyltransferase domain-containing protein n=1 Tax=Prauserella alba TaxID=176898 RepID=A0ABP4G2N1_9PSEU|nr:heparan-alpha-glucosaminide N-acetyltransferase domain-containing protein [Prauserella alba]
MGIRTRSPAASPTATSRLTGVDATRGIAVLGMMAVHALYIAGSSGDPAWWYSIVSGRSAATFAVLAGVGIAFTTRREQVPRARWRPVTASLVTRALAVGLLGLALGYTDSDIAAVILPFYAVLFLLAIPLVFLSTRLLLVTGAAVAAVVPTLSQLFRDVLPEPSYANPSFGYLVDDPLGLLSELAVTGIYPALPWTAYLCAGLVIGRLRLSSLRVDAWLLAGGAALAAVASALSALLLGPLGGRGRLVAVDGSSVVDGVLEFGAPGTTPTTSWWWLAVDARHSSTPLDLLHTTGTATALLGALLLLTNAPKVGALARLLASPLAAIGALTLTVYSAHIVFLNSPLDRFGALSGYLVQVAVAVAFAMAWRRFVGRGPLEWAVTWLAGRAGAIASQGRFRLRRSSP